MTRWLPLLLTGCLFITPADRAAREALLGDDSGGPTISGDDDDDLTPQPTGPEATELDGRWLAVDVGLWATCAIDDRRTVHCWGDEVDLWWPEVPVDGFDAASVSVGLEHGCAVSTGGQTRCFGPAAGTANNAEPGILEIPDATFTEVACGPSGCCGLDAGSLVCFDTEPKTPSGTLASATGLEHVSVWGDGCVTTTAGDVDCFTFLSTGGADPQAPYDTDVDWLDMNEGAWACARQATTGEVGCWSLATTGAITPIDVPLASPMSALQALDNGNTPYVCGLQGGAVACYGPAVLSAPPVPEAPAGNWVQLSMRGDVGCVIDGQGVMACWGEGDGRPR